MLRIRAVLALPLLAACAPDPWTAARATCGFQEGETLDGALVERQGDGWNALEVDGACAERLIRDLDGDPDEVLALFEGGDDLGAYMAEARTKPEPVDGLPVAVWGMYWLVGSDFGAVGDLQEGPYVDAKWVEVIGEAAAARGHDDDAPLSQVLYDLVATRIRGLALLPEEMAPASMGLDVATDVLHLPRTISLDFDYAHDPYAADLAGTGLAHEADHAVEGHVEHVVCDWVAAEACDVDLTGANGFEIAMEWAQVAALVDGASCVERTSVDGARAWALEERIRDRFADFIYRDLPERQLVACE